MVAQYAVAEGIFVQGVGDELVVLSMESGLYYSFNGVGAAIWRLAEAGKDTSQIAAAIAAEYDVEESQAAADAEAFLRDAFERSLLVERAAS